jgi:hypothetical protein
LIASIMAVSSVQAATALQQVLLHRTTNTRAPIIADQRERAPLFGQNCVTERRFVYSGVWITRRVS